MNKQKYEWSNPFGQKSDHIQKKYGIDRNNNNNNGKNAINRMIPRHNAWSVQPIFNQSTALKSCLKINDKSKGVQKGKLKTPAQDRLQKIVKIEPTAVTDLLKLVNLNPTVKNVLPKKYWPPGHAPESVNSVKSNAVVKIANNVRPAQAFGNVNCAKLTQANQIEWPKLSNAFAPSENVSKIQATTITFDAAKSFASLFHLPGNGLQTCQLKSVQSDIIKKGHDFQVQNRLKINDNSKIIGVKKFKSKTPAQDRLQKLVDKNKAALVESLKECAEGDMIVSDSKSQRKSIGIQKSHVTGAEPSIIDIVNKSGCKIDVNAGPVAATAAGAAAAATAYIIPDTNVFLNSLACIKNVIDRGLKYIVFVPFVVLQELDGLKQRHGEQNFTVKFNAKRAIRYIYELSTSDNKRLQGQSAIEDKNLLIDSKSNDDKILNCCLQLVKQSKKVILVTNDLNLTNTAKFSGIETITQKSCFDKFQ